MRRQHERQAREERRAKHAARKALVSPLVTHIERRAAGLDAIKRIGPVPKQQQPNDDNNEKKDEKSHG